jgi:hypothetical protein
MANTPEPKPKDRDERVTIPLDPVEALRALLQVQPDEDPASSESSVAE